MNENNLDYLQNTLKYLGFGESVNEKLKESVEKGLPEFTLCLDLSMPAVNAKDKPELADSMQYQLQFSKSKETDMYFFNKYQAFLDPAGKNYSVVDQVFS